eukprot:TRINITY_DN12770_c0_g1_i1.p1 TRINITY_DN12770_c0_g1~~TRINITY_DN12770_c0_g1_i1.p1  ORF type:complete len:561 (-),score=112.60 TRINITY_DN12770_c0_g1_i1:89-1771(-)
MITNNSICCFSMTQDFFFGPVIEEKYQVTPYILGKGRYGVVKVGEDCTDGKKVAIKILSKPGGESTVPGLLEADENDHGLLQEDILHEIEMMKNLDQTNIVKMFDSYENHLQVCIVMELVPKGTLLELIEQGGKGLSDSTVRKFTKQLVDGLFYLHEICYIAHRDLKAENVFVDANRDLKIGDFGFAVRFDPTGESQIRTECGTLLYFAPEILNKQLHVGPEVDVWSLGVLVYFMLTGKYPFEGPTDFDTATLITSMVYPEDIRIDMGVDNLLGEIFVPLEVRVTIDTVRGHPWLAGKKGVFERCHNSAPSRSRKVTSSFTNSGRLQMVEEDFYKSDGKEKKKKKSRRKNKKHKDQKKRKKTSSITQSMKTTKKNSRTGILLKEKIAWVKNERSGRNTFTSGDRKRVLSALANNSIDLGEDEKSKKTTGRKQKKTIQEIEFDLETISEKERKRKKKKKRGSLSKTSHHPTLNKKRKEKIRSSRDQQIKKTTSASNFLNPPTSSRKNEKNLHELSRSRTHRIVLDDPEFLERFKKETQRREPSRRKSNSDSRSLSNFSEKE